MCLAPLLMTSDDGPLCQEAMWLGPTCADGLEICHGERVLVLKQRSSLWSTSETDGLTFIPCFGCEAELLLCPSLSSAGRGQDATDTRGWRVRARETLLRPMRRSTFRRT